MVQHFIGPLAIGGIILFIILMLIDDDLEDFVKGIVFTIGMPIILFIIWSAVQLWYHWPW